MLLMVKLMGRLVAKALPHQYKFINSKAKFPALVAGLGCIRGDTLIHTEYGLIPISQVSPTTKVLSLNHQTNELEFSPSSGGFPKGKANLYQVSTEQGEFRSTEHHRFFSLGYNYQSLKSIGYKTVIAQISCKTLHSMLDTDCVVNYSKIDEGLLGNYGVLARLYGQLFLLSQDDDLTLVPLPAYAQECTFYPLFGEDAHTGISLMHNHHGQYAYHSYKQDYISLCEELVEVLEGQTSTLHSEHILHYLQRVQLFHPMFFYHHNTEQHSVVSHSFSPLLTPDIKDNPIISCSLSESAEIYWDIQVLGNNNYICKDGFIHHNSGKSEALIYRTLKFLTEIPKARIGIYEPTIDLTKRILYPRFEDIFANSGIPYKLNKSDGIMQIWMPLGLCEIIFRSMDNYSRIIGYETHHAILDEIDTLPKDKAMEVWVRVLARNRKRFLKPDGSRGMNTVGITTTPEGFNFVYEMWMKIHVDNPDYELIRGKTKDNHHLHPDYVPTLMATYPAQLIGAYLEGEFVNLSGQTVYSGFNRDKNNTKLTITDWLASDTLHIGMDFNIGRMSAVIGMKPSDGSKQLYVIDEFHNLMDTPTMIEAIRARYRDRIIVIYPDASGKSRKSIDASKSDIRLLKDAGFRINAPQKNPPIRERVLSMNTLFLNGEGERNLYVNVNKCPNFVEALEKQVYDDNGIPIKDGKEDINDAAGYLVNRVFGLAKPQTVIGKMRVG